MSAREVACTTCGAEIGARCQTVYWVRQDWPDGTFTYRQNGRPTRPHAARVALSRATPERQTCAGCFREVRPGIGTDHARGCPTGQNGTPNYN